MRPELSERGASVAASHSRDNFLVLQISSVCVELFDGHLTGTDTTLLLPNIQPPDARCLGHIVNQTATHALDQTIKWTTMDKEIEETVVMGSFLLFIFVSSHILHSLRNMVVWLKRFALEY